MANILSILHVRDLRRPPSEESSSGTLRRQLRRSSPLTSSSSISRVPGISRTTSRTASRSARGSIALASGSDVTFQRHPTLSHGGVDLGVGSLRHERSEARDLRARCPRRRNRRPSSDGLRHGRPRPARHTRDGLLPLQPSSGGCRRVEPRASCVVIGQEHGSLTTANEPHTSKPSTVDATRLHLPQRALTWPATPA